MRCLLGYVVDLLSLLHYSAQYSCSAVSMQQKHVIVDVNKHVFFLHVCSCGGRVMFSCMDGMDDE